MRYKENSSGVGWLLVTSLMTIEVCWSSDIENVILLVGLSHCWCVGVHVILLSTIKLNYKNKFRYDNVSHDLSYFGYLWQIIFFSQTQNSSPYKRDFFLFTADTKVDEWWTDLSYFVCCCVLFQIHFIFRPQCL